MAKIPEHVRGLNFYDIDENLNVFLRRHAPQLIETHNKTFKNLGDFAGNRLDRQAEQSDQNFPPQLMDIPDNRITPKGRKKELRLNPEYEACQQELYRHGLLADCFQGKNKASHILPFIGQYLASQSDIATGCPFAMTHPVAYVLDTIAPQKVKEKFLPEILRTDGQTAICGTWATERHSGSDVGGSVTKAVKDDADETIRLFGHNWFTSAFGFKKFMAIKTARPQGAATGAKGLGLYLVPSHINQDWNIENNLEITHLKRKLGTRALPTVEVNLEGTIAYEIAPEGQGIRAMMTALGCSRVHNAMAAAGVMHRAYREALSWAAHRETFGEKLITRPMIQKRLLDIKTQWVAGSVLAFEAARSFDDVASNKSQSPKKMAWMRIITALAKYKTADQAVWSTQKALELVGGNGYTEDYPTARQYRDAMVLTVWEGPEQVQALELMRMVAAPGQDLAKNPFLERMHKAIKSLPPEMDSEKIRLEKYTLDLYRALAVVSSGSADVELIADEYLHKMSNMMTYALMCEEAAWELKHDNNVTKRLLAQNYYDSHSNHGLTEPKRHLSPLHASFNNIVKGQRIAPSDLKKDLYPRKN